MLLSKLLKNKYNLRWNDRLPGNHWSGVAPTDMSYLQSTLFINNCDGTTSLPIRDYNSAHADNSCTDTNFCGASAVVEKDAGIFAQ